MSQRYLAGFIQAGLFNPLVAPTPTYTYELWSWGSNSFGQLGLGTSGAGTYKSSPNQVGALTTWSITIAGNADVLAIKTDGTLWSWGRNQAGQLGLGDIASRSSPVQVGALTTWSVIKIGDSHSVAIKTNGTLWSWGSNNQGQLGLGTSGAGTYKSSPTQVGSLTTWSQIACGNVHTLAIKTDGSLWSWGRNSLYGALGLGDAVNRSSPTQVGALTTWSQIAGGSGNSVAIKTNGTLWTWGRNTQGQLGLSSAVYSSSSPAQVGALTTWLTVACGGYQVITVKTDGTLWAWGLNAQGQLGLNNTTNYSSPKQVSSLTTWSKIIGGTTHTIATKTDGTLWSWGDNADGQLGQGNTTGLSSPKQVGALTTWYALGGGYSNTIALKY
tara:strand:+ start:189 stop:1340 length:1152 start_codon:yes stop_codon:yes gene_type:complete